MATPSRFTAAERIESVKAAFLGGTCGGAVSVGLIISRLLGWGTVPGMGAIELHLATVAALINVGSAVLAGALFALTYRYAVRCDRNPQLKAGVVFAFTCIRGLARVDTGSAIVQNVWPLALACGESLLLFGLTAMICDLAQQRQWITPFGSAD